MTGSRMGVSPEHRLRGKVNFITWKREFEREAKAHDVLDLFTGDEEILEKPPHDIVCQIYHNILRNQGGNNHIQSP